MYLIFFIVITVSIIIILTISIFVKVITIYSFKENKVSQTLSASCPIDFTKHPDISSLPCCVDLNGDLTQRKYLSTKDIVVSPNITPYFNVCSGHCLLGVDPNDISKCLDGLGQEKLDTCIAELRPDNCTGEVNPVAYIGGIKYYAYAIGELLCLNKRPCVIN